MVGIFRVIKSEFNKKINPSNFRKEGLKKLIFAPCRSPIPCIAANPKGDILPCGSFQCINNPNTYRVDNLNKVKDDHKIRTYNPILKEILFDRFGFLKLFLRVRKNKKLRKQFLKKDYYSICDLCLLILKHKNLVQKTSKPSDLEILFFVICNSPYFLLGILERVLDFSFNFALKFLMRYEYGIEVTT